MIYTVILYGILLGAILGIAIYLRKKCLDIEELCLRIAATTSLAENRAEERTLNLDYKLGRIMGLLAAELDPDTPDEGEKTEEEKKAEKEFTECVMNILNYSSRKGMGS